MKFFSNKKLIFSLLLFVFLCTFTSCDEDETETTPPINCTEHGLHYNIDGGNEIYLPQTIGGINTNSYTHSNSTLGNHLMIHQLGNGFIFQSNATDLQQESTHVVGVLTEGSQLDINIWSNTDLVNITYTCKRLDDEVDGVVYYKFNGDYTTANITHQISGYICVILDIVN